MSNNAPENVTPEGEQVTGEDFDPYAVPLEELEQKIESAKYAEEETPGAEESAEEVVEEAPDEGQEEVETAAEVEAEPEPEPEEPKATEEESPVSDEDILRARLEHAEAQAKHFETELGRKAGLSGHLKEKYEQLEAQVKALQQGQAPPPQQDEYGEIHREQQQQQQPRQPAQGDPMRSYVIGSAIRDGGSDFLQSHPDVLVDDGNGQKVMDPEFAKAMEESGFNPESLMLSDDPLYVRAEVSRALESTFNRVSALKRKTHLDELMRKKSDELEKLREKKRVSAASPGSPSRARPTPKKFDPWKADLDVLRKKIDDAREAGDT